MHLAHPLGVKGFRYRRVKNDVRDAADLADLLRMGRLPEAWIAPPATRELRELVRYRAKLVAIAIRAEGPGPRRAGQGRGVDRGRRTCSGSAGANGWLRCRWAAAYAERVRSLLELIDVLDAPRSPVRRRWSPNSSARHVGYQAIQQVPGVGPMLAAVFVAEIGDVHRFAGPAQLCSWAGLTPRHRESDTVVHRGHITKQGSKLVRWAAIEAVQRHPTTAKIAADKAPYRSSPRQEHRQGRRGTQTAHAGLLRAARRPHPRARPRQGGVSTPDATRARPLHCLTPDSAWSPT